MKIFTSICIANSIFLYFFHGPEYPAYETFSMFLPFANLGAIWLILGTYTIYWWLNYEKYFETQYLKKNYSTIWKDLHPWGDISVNGFAGLSFVLGKYDDGTDKHLSYIKQNHKETIKMVAWVFFLVPVVWLLNILSMLLAGI